MYHELQSKRYMQRYGIITTARSKVPTGYWAMKPVSNMTYTSAATLELVLTATRWRADLPARI